MEMIWLGLAIAVALLASAGYWVTKRDLAALRAKALAESDYLHRALADASSAREQLATEVEALAEFRPVLDAVHEAGRILRAAQLEADQIVQAAKVSEAAALKTSADLNTQSIAEVAAARAQAAGELKEARHRAGQIVEDANRKAAELVRRAEAEAAGKLAIAREDAQRVAGDALQAVENARHFEHVAAAMKNLIDGYGDRYLIPSHSVLDDLAIDYGFTEAGQNLKAAREHTRAMITQNLAADCEYVEAGRRGTAIRFAVDAFNGRVDSILSRAKHDNVGTLQKEIQDAFQMVNHHGRAFRDARILPGFLEARIAELKWAIAVQVIKQNDQEEQRRLRDLLREEEKAQREFERSLKQASKEEDLVRKALEKVQDQAARATDEQRVKFEAQLAELRIKLAEAEERGQRALSMAQQTKLGHVYVISNVGSFGEEVFKIGMTRRLEPLDRVRELGDASVPFSFDVHALLKSDDAPALERLLHQRFMTAQVNKVNPRKEFFRVGLTELRAAVEDVGIVGQWTLAAEAREYKETLAIEQALREDPIQAERWIHEQEDYVPTDGLDDEGANP